MQITSVQMACGAFDGIRAPRILLLEQDGAVRHATRLLLKSDGYRVSAAGSLAEALEHVTDDPDVDLLVIGHYSCHVGMRLVATIRDRLDRPLRAVVMADDAPLGGHKAGPDPLTCVVSKPVNELLTLVSTLIIAY
jgi:CheY-like chemotaxis protein